MTEGGKNLRAFIQKQPWFGEAVEKAAEVRAMEMLNELIGDDAESRNDEFMASIDGDGAEPAREVEPITSHPGAQFPENGRRKGGWKYNWHNVNGIKGSSTHQYATGSRGEKLEVKRGQARGKRADNGTSTYWWLSFVNGNLIERTYTMRDAKLRAEWEVGQGD